MTCPLCSKKDLPLLSAQKAIDGLKEANDELRKKLREARRKK